MSTIGIVGLHALPNSHGGYEQYFSYIAENNRFQTYAENNKIIFYCADNYGTTPKQLNFSPVAPSKGESGWRYYSNAIKQASRDCDFIYCCGTGVSIGLLLRLPTLYRRSVTVAINVDGEEHKRTKYKLLQRWIILGFHILSMIMADFIILDSKSLAGRLPLTGIYSRKLAYIPYFFPDKLKLDPAGSEHADTDPYDLVVARLVPENNVELIIRAKLESNDHTPLRVVGDTNSEYGNYLAKTYGTKIRFLGGVYDQRELNRLRRNCRYYIHGHSVGGTNPSLIEALGLCSTIFAFRTPYNEEAAADYANYFQSEGELEGFFDGNTELTNNTKSRIQTFDEDAGISELIRLLERRC